MSGPIYPQTPPRAWVLQERTGTGTVVIAQHEAHWGPAEAILCRIDPAARVIFLWDKVARKEVAVKVGDLFPAKVGV